MSQSNCLDPLNCRDPHCSPSVSLPEVRRVLRRKEDLLRLLVESVEDYAIFALDLEGRVTSWNRGAERIKGYTEEEILGKHFSLFYPAEDTRAGKPEHALRVAAAEGRFEDRGWRVRNDGSRFWANVVLSPLRDDGGQLIGFAKVTRDLTERKLAEERARDFIREHAAREEAEAAKTRTAAILESISDGFFAVDPEGRFRYVNGRAEEILRCSREALLGSTIREKLPGLIGPAALRECHRVARERQSAEFEHFCPPLDIWLRVHVYRCDEGFSVYFHDITAQKRADEVLRESERRLREVVDLLPVGVFLADADGRILWHNPAGRTIWGGTRFVEIEGYGQYKGWWPDTGRRIRAEEWALARALRGERVAGEVVEIEAFDGTRKTILNSAFPLRAASGEITAAVVLNEDVSERERAEAALRARKKALGIVSHELRNPLHVIRLQLATFGLDHTGSLGAAELKRLEAIKRSAHQMARLIDDLLQGTLIEAGHLEVRPSRHEVSSLVHEAVDALEPLARSAGSRLESSVPEQLRRVMADRQRIHQVLTNLVENAIKHAPGTGTITIRVQSMGREVCFSVSDTGPGISEEDLPHLFDPYWQASETRRGGAGLGLSIAKGIVEAHGGRIWVESEPGRGSTFFFSIPAADAARGAGSTRGAEPPMESGHVSAHGSVARESFAPAAEQEGASDRSAWFLSRIRDASIDPADAAALADLVRERILAALVTGQLHEGDRLPSIRALAEALGSGRHAAVRVYAELAGAGIVERRERSGVYVPSLGRLGADPPGETAQWMAGVLTGACDHQIRIPFLSDLLNRCTTSARLVCACVESDGDSIAALRGELEHHFGIESLGLDTRMLAIPPAEALRKAPEELRKADLWVTSAIHAPLLRRWADQMRKPLVVASMHPDHVAAIDAHLRERPLTVACIDPRYADRLRALFTDRRPDHIRAMVVDEGGALAALHPEEPILLTRAARERISQPNFRLLVPISPAFSPESSHHLVRVLLRLNLEIGQST